MTLFFLYNLAKYVPKLMHFGKSKCKFNSKIYNEQLLGSKIDEKLSKRDEISASVN